MARLLLKLLGIKGENGANVTHPGIALHGGVHPAVLVLLGLGLAALALWLYRREDEIVRPFKRWTMALLRIVFIGLLLLLIARPVLNFTMENTVRRGLIVLADVSISMNIKDPRTEAPDLKRAALGTGMLDPRKGLYQNLSPEDGAKVAAISRIDLLKAVLADNGKLDLLNRLAKDYDLKLQAFQDSVD